MAWSDTARARRRSLIRWKKLGVGFLEEGAFVVLDPNSSTMDDVTRAMSKGGACECPRVGVFFNFSEGG